MPLGSRWVLAIICIATFDCSQVRNAPSKPSPPRIPGATSVGREVCRVCHASQDAEFEKTIHARLARFERSPDRAQGCEFCHGPGSLHVSSNGLRTGVLRFGAKLEDDRAASRDFVIGYRRMSLEDKARAAGYCLNCHDSSAHMDWVGSRHDLAGVTCVTCHNPMKATPKLLRQQEPLLCYTCHSEKQAQAFYPSHHPIEERKINCSDCHNQHGSTTRGLLRADSTNELCASCHPEKQGPFVFEHPPATESCAICHEPHGTIADNLMRQSEPFLCLSCHAGHQGPLVPLNDVVATPEKRASFYTKCTQCHDTIHGTDLPSSSGNGRFTR